MSIYNSGYDAIWKQFAGNIGAEYIAGHYGASDQVIATDGPWKVQFDTHTASAISGTWTYQHSYTRVKAFFHSPDGLTFQVQRKGLWGRISGLLGSRGIETGIPPFDSRFDLKGNNREKVQVLFCGPTIRSLLEQLEDAKIKVLTGEGPRSEQFPEGASVLYCNMDGVFTDTGKLRNLHSLFVELLTGLSSVGSAAPFIPTT